MVREEGVGGGGGWGGGGGYKVESPFTSVLFVIQTKRAFKGRSELRSCVKVEVALLRSPSLIICMVSVDVKQH